ncbi:hypothetical protein NC653_004912 [Populus alba x Populus x berolinensis]|uniref:WAT1-related protein n=1 Tax=Populus alba x Populus x berolinensis TaxID=444605 RepID=A0AAD6RBQ3_9ROSI|nr:hypothetical protein NC653_004912 [Populus alba x Populus x berolinensis]
MGNQTPCDQMYLGLNKVKPYLAMVSLQFGYAGMYIITMVSLKHGMSHYILAMYRHVVATIVIAHLLPLKIRPKLTLPIFLRILALGFLELETVTFKKLHKAQPRWWGRYHGHRSNGYDLIQRSNHRFYKIARAAHHGTTSNASVISIGLLEH